MKLSNCCLRKQLAGCLVIFLAMPLAEAATVPQQQSLSGQQPLSASSAEDQPQNSNSRATKAAADTNRSEDTYPDNPDRPQSQAAGQSGQPGSSKSGSEQQQNGASQPVGTAAAPYEKTTGVAASRPAGAVIAPAKQRRARSILIRVAILVGAGVAIGTVVALSRASSSRPN